MWKMQLLQLLGGLRIAVSKTIPQPKALRPCAYDGAVIKLVTVHSVWFDSKGI